MIFQSFQIKGKGLGKSLGFPTINIKPPPSFTLDDGIYASWVRIKNKTFAGALFYGPISIFNQFKKSLEVYLITSENIEDKLVEEIEVEIVKKIREVIKFKNEEKLIEQINKDVNSVKKVLKLSTD